MISIMNISAVVSVNEATESWRHEEGEKIFWFIYEKAFKLNILDSPSSAISIKPSNYLPGQPASYIVKVDECISPLN